MESKALKLVKNRLWVVWLMFGIFLIMFGMVIHTGGGNATEIAWLLLDVWVLIIDFILLIKYKFPSIRSIGISCLLGVLVFLSYMDVIIRADNSGIFSLIVLPLITILTAMACFRVFEVYPKQALVLFKGKTKKAVCISILLGMGFGIVWGIINYFLMLQNNEPHLHITIHCFFLSLSPAVLEEIVMRTVFYALCIAFLHGKVQTKFHRFTYWTMMILPHVLVHTPDAFRKGGLIDGLISTVLYVIIFGLIFAILQKKRDISSAMIAHGTVDFIRFCFFGVI